MRNDDRGAATPLTIVHVLGPEADPDVHGVVKSLAAGHAGYGHNVQVVALCDDRHDARGGLQALVRTGVEVVPLPQSGRRRSRARKALAALCTNVHPSVVHTHGFRADVEGAAAARLVGRPALTTVHGRGSDWWWEIGRRRRALRAFDAVVAVSREIAEQLSAIGIPHERLHLVGNAHPGCSEVLPPADARHALGVPDDRRHIGWIAELHRTKGADVLVRAVHRLAERNLLVSIIGDGPERRPLERLVASLGMEDVFHFHGVVPNPTQFVGCFDVIVLSSRSEGCPAVLLEAVAARVPVIASRVGGIPDVVSDREALLVPPDQPELLASAMAACLRNPKSAAARAARAATRLSTNASYGSWLDRYEQLYRALQRNLEPAERVAL